MKAQKKKEEKEEEAIKADAKAKVIEATGLVAEEKNAALARRRSSENKLSSLINQANKAVQINSGARRRSLIPKNMEQALSNNSRRRSVDKMKKQLADMVSSEDIGNIEKGREAATAEKVQQIKSKLAFTKAANS